MDTRSERSAVPMESEAWVDPKRKLWAIGLVVPFLPFAAGALAYTTDVDLFWWMGPVLLFVVIPLIDQLVGLDLTNPPESAMATLEGDKLYRRVLWAFVPLQLVSLVFGSWVWATGDLSLVAKLGLISTIGVVGGVGINAAHELGHKRPVVERWLSKLSLSQSLYGHFYVEHNRGHHKNVATPEDPASSRFGENLYEFLPRTVIGSLRSAIEIERERSTKAGVSFWRVRNDLLNAWAMSVLLFGGIVAVFGVVTIPFLIAQAVIGFGLLEVVNYLEHYGLQRQKNDHGRYEKCRPEHSWNANHIASNLAIYNLQRHSDHHANATRRYQTLRHFEESPQLPAGYPAMILLATVPPLWRKVMDRRVADHYGGDLRLANLHPRTARRMLAAHDR